MHHVPQTRKLTDSVFFVTATLRDRKRLFTSETAAKVVLQELQHYRDTREIELYGYVIMPDHVHVLLKVCAPLTLSVWLRRFKTFTARSIGQGPIWQAGSWTEMIISEPVLLQKLVYIHENPVRARLVLNAAEYKLSSAAEYMKQAHSALLDPF